ncbi:hypothetical protein SAMN05414139_01467 [Burkholderia sp. D7]|nr:hypothetical protein SAMN05414139_01467 [Burkholderia sp. D7]
MKARPAVTLRAVALSDWTPDVGRGFARVGIRQVVCCDPGAEIGTDAADAAELARRWNDHSRMLVALQLIARADSLHRARALAENVLGSSPGIEQTRFAAVR